VKAVKDTCRLSLPQYKKAHHWKGVSLPLQQAGTQFNFSVLTLSSSSFQYYYYTHCTHEQKPVSSSPKSKSIVAKTVSLFNIYFSHGHIAYTITMFLCIICVAWYRSAWWNGLLKYGIQNLKKLQFSTILYFYSSLFASNSTIPSCYRIKFNFRHIYCNRYSIKWVYFRKT